MLAALKLLRDASGAERWTFLHYDPATKRIGRTRTNPNNAGPATLALTLPYTQRTDAMKVERVLFSTSERLLVEIDTVSEVLRTARYRLARENGNKTRTAAADNAVSA